MIYFPANRMSAIQTVQKMADRISVGLSKLDNTSLKRIGTEVSKDEANLYYLEEKAVLERLCDEAQKLVASLGSMQGRAEYAAEITRGEYYERPAINR